MPVTECFCESLDVKAYRPTEIISAGSFVDDLEDAYPRGKYYPRRKLDEFLDVPCCRPFSLGCFADHDCWIALTSEGFADRCDFNLILDTRTRFDCCWEFHSVDPRFGNFDFSISDKHLNLMVRLPVDELVVASSTDSRVIALNAILSHSDLGQVTDIQTTKAGPQMSLASGQLTLTGGHHDLEGTFSSSSAALTLRLQLSSDSWVYHTGWQFVEANFDIFTNVRCELGYRRAKYEELWPELNETWPYGWNMGIGFTEALAYDSPDRPFRRPSFATNEIPVRLPVLYWHGKEKWLRAEVVHTADESFPELILSGTEAQQKQMLKKTGYEFERWDGPMVDRWT